MILYSLTQKVPNILEFKLIHLASKVINYMKEKKIFISTKGVMISYFGSAMILEDYEGSSAESMSIIIPEMDRLIENRNIVATKSFKFTVDLSNYAIELCNAFGELSLNVNSCRGSPCKNRRIEPYIIVLSTNKD